MSGPDLLRPTPWRLESVPAALPLLLRIDRRDPLPAAVLAELAASLSPQERQRLTALRRPDDRERFLLGRGALRRLLGAWLELAPAAVSFESGPHGKPRCPGGPEFNLSHSGHLILLALHPSRPVGVDVERPRPALDWRPIARRVLPPADCEALEALAAAAPAEAADAFLLAWCRLEARLKARGEGFSGLARLAGATAGEGGGCLWDVAVPDGYRAAVALAA